VLPDIIKMISIYIMGRKYEVPQGLTILKAMEFAGYRVTRGCGCRGGVCGACVTLYRRKGSYKLNFGLACQTVVEPDMYLMQLPFVPANKAIYSIKNVGTNDSDITKLYPELMRCLACGTCTKACPQEIDVKQYMADAMRGEIAAVADRSFDCIMCGMCAARCPAEESQYNIAILARRLYGKYLAPQAQHLAERVAAVEAGEFDAELAELKAMPLDELRKRYNERDIEPA